jgi:hypothetical protein
MPTKIAEFRAVLRKLAKPLKRKHGKDYPDLKKFWRFLRVADKDEIADIAEEWANGLSTPEARAFVESKDESWFKEEEKVPTCLKMIVLHKIWFDPKFKESSRTFAWQFIARLRDLAIASQDDDESESEGDLGDPDAAPSSSSGSNATDPLSALAGLANLMPQGMMDKMSSRAMEFHQKQQERDEPITPQEAISEMLGIFDMQDMREVTEGIVKSVNPNDLNQSKDFQKFAQRMKESGERQMAKDSQQEKKGKDEGELGKADVIQDTPPVAEVPTSEQHAHVTDEAPQKATKVAGVRQKIKKNKKNKN